MKKKGILEGRKSKGGTRTLGRLCGLLITALLAEGMPSGTIVSTYASQHGGLESTVEMYEEKGEEPAAKGLIYTLAKEAADSGKGKKDDVPSENDSENNDQEDAVPTPTKKPKKTPAPTPKDTEVKEDGDLTGEDKDSSKESGNSDQEDAVPAPTKKPKKTPTPAPKDEELDKEEDPSEDNDKEDSSSENNDSDSDEDKTPSEDENNDEDEDENDNDSDNNNNEDNDDKNSDKEDNDRDDDDNKDEEEEDKNGEGDDLEDAVPTPTKKPKKTPTPTPDKELGEGEPGEDTASPSEKEDPENSQTPTPIPTPTKAPSKTWPVKVPTESDDARYQYLLGIDSRVITIDNPPAGYRNATEAARNMKTITVPVWKMTASGGRMTSSMQLTINKKLARNVQEIFKEIYALELKFPIKVLKGFMYRKVGGVALSKSRIMSIHSFGAAIDINPGDYDNDYYLGKGNDLRDKSNPYCIPDEVIAIFEKYGWFWGGNFEICADTMHFQYFELGMLTYQDNWPFRRLKVKSGYMAGADVRNLQQRLRELGFFVSVDGVYGNKTADAIMRYQKSRGLEATGEMDYKTWETIINETHYMSYAF